VGVVTSLGKERETQTGRGVVTGLGFRPARFQKERERERDVERDRDRETEVIPKEIFREREVRTAV
jgi:hypothetical protein